MQLGVLLKGASTFEEAIKAFNEVKTINPNYGPLYRELAETYNKWAVFKRSSEKEYQKLALENYIKYMSLTDYSLTSRMRYADFLIKNKDYKSLEEESKKMKELDNVNPRILRYLGYSAYENGNVDDALDALQKFILNPVNKIISSDYLYLGQAKIKKGISADGRSVDQVLLASAFEDFNKAISMEPLVLKEFSELGKNYFTLKLYNVSAFLFGHAIESVDSKTYLEDALYYAICVVSVNRNKTGAELDVISLDKADKVVDDFIIKRPDYVDAYFFKARINDLRGKYVIMANNYQLFVDGINAKGETEIIKNKAKFIEAYNKIAENYANLNDKVREKEFLNKTLALDPENPVAIENMKKLLK